nr:hypothetical protein [Variovorax boronicumulans]
MNVRDKLHELSIYVPTGAHRYRMGKGCLEWLQADHVDGAAALFRMPVTREQYESMMGAGLLCPVGRAVEAPYVAPIAVLPRRRARRPAPALAACG